MSELHTYRITYPSGEVRACVAIEAFSASDAVAQWRDDERCEVRRVLRVEPLPDAPAVPDEIDRANRKALEGPLHFSVPDAPTLGQVYADADELIRQLNAKQRAEAQRPVKTTSWANALLDEMAGKLGVCREANETLSAQGIEREAEIEKLRERLGQFSKILDSIATLVWPGIQARATDYNLADLVEAVRKMGAETEERRQRCVTLRIERDTLQRQNEAGSAEVVAEMDKTREMKSERDALQASVDKLDGLLEEATARTVEAEAKRDGWRREFDALQKRIDAAKERIAFASTSTDPNLAKLGSDMIAILEGRAP